MEKNCGARQATGDYIIQHMRIACWITKATDTLRIRNTYSFPTATVVTQMCLSVILFVHHLSCLMCYTGRPKYPAARPYSGKRIECNEETSYAMSIVTCWGCDLTFP